MTISIFVLTFYNTVTPNYKNQIEDTFMHATSNLAFLLSEFFFFLEGKVCLSF